MSYWIQIKATYFLPEKKNIVIEILWPVFLTSYKNQVRLQWYYLDQILLVRRHYSIKQFHLHYLQSLVLLFLNHILAD